MPLDTTTPPGPGRIPTRAEHLADVLERRIRDASLSPGDGIGTLESLRSETGFARATVSEAVRLLRERGLIEIRPGRGGGLFVAETNAVVRLRHTLLSVADEPTAVADAIELREHLELLVALGAARRRSAGDIEDLQAHLEALRAAPDWVAFMAANWDLHRRIAGLCPNAMARAVYVGTLGHLDSTTPTIDAADAEGYRASRLAIHVELVEAIASGDVASVTAAVARHHGSA